MFVSQEFGLIHLNACDSKQTTMQRNINSFNNSRLHGWRSGPTNTPCVRPSSATATGGFATASVTAINVVVEGGGCCVEGRDQGMTEERNLSCITNFFSVSSEHLVSACRLLKRWSALLGTTSSYTGDWSSDSCTRQSLHLLVFTST